MTRLSYALVVLALACNNGGTDTEDDTDTTDSTDTTDTTDDTTDTNDTTETADTDVGLPDVEGVDCPSDTLCILSGTITEDLTLTANVNWVISGGVFIGDDVNRTTLTINPGTKVFGENATGGFLVITRGSQIHAEGTAERPIVFTIDQPEGSRFRGGWGGIVLRGRAPINVCTDLAAGDVCEAELEGGAGQYGGDDPHDSSGVLKYVRVEFAGYAISPDNELNGITFGGVGDGTEVEYIQIHKGNDDGFEFFGGTVNAKHVLISCPTDDGLDWDNGYSGHIQFAAVVQCADAGNNAMEGDNHPTAFTVAPLSHPTFSNITLLGDSALPAGNMGIMARRGTSGVFANILATGFTGACFSLRDQATVDHMTADGGFDHVLLDCGTAFEANDFADDAADLFDAGAGNNANVADLMLATSVWGSTNPNFAPMAGSPAASGGEAPVGGFIEAASYVGAFAPGGADWTDGWTTFVEN